jgi:hypothetical protein
MPIFGRRLAENGQRRRRLNRSAGAARTFDVDPVEAQAVADEAVRALEGFNAVVSSGVLAEDMGTPSPDVCRYCEYRAVCAPFFRAYSVTWGWYRASMLGLVETAEYFGDYAVVTVRAEAPSDLAPPRARACGWPTHLVPAENSRVAVVDAAPTPRADEIRMAWETRVALWR